MWISSLEDVASPRLFGLVVVGAPDSVLCLAVALALGGPTPSSSFDSGPAYLHINGKHSSPVFVEEMALAIWGHI